MSNINNAEIKLAASVLLTVLPRVILGSTLITLAHALAGAMSADMERDGERPLTEDEREVAAVKLILLAIKDVNARFASTPSLPEKAPEPAPTPDPVTTADPKSLQAAGDEFNALVERIRKRLQA